MTSDAASRGVSLLSRWSSRGARHLGFGVLGIVALLLLWKLGIWLLTLSPQMKAFVGFGPIHTFAAFPTLWHDGTLQNAIGASMYRLSYGLGIAVAIGVPLGIVMGLSRRFCEISNSPFQFIRMISPLAWMPLAVIVFPTYDNAIIYLIVIAAVWPVAYATHAGLEKVDPAWFKVARNLGAKRIHLLSKVVLPAIAFDVFSGMRLALGVAWVVLVPAELLGVTSGLGYAIDDARETLSYDHLAAMVVTIGVLGFTLDTIFVALINKFSWYHRKAES